MNSSKNLKFSAFSTWQKKGPNIIDQAMYGIYTIDRLPPVLEWLLSEKGDPERRTEAPWKTKLC